MSSYIPICVALVASALQGPHYSWFLNLVCRHPGGHFGGNWYVANSLPTQ